MAKKITQISHQFILKKFIIRFSYRNPAELIPDELIVYQPIRNENLDQPISAGKLISYQVIPGQFNLDGLIPSDYKNLLLIIMFAWDGGSYVGNEYWQGYLTSSGDPAQASCSTIPYTQNPKINKFIDYVTYKQDGGRYQHVSLSQPAKARRLKVNVYQ